MDAQLPKSLWRFYFKFAARGYIAALIIWALVAMVTAADRTTIAIAHRLSTLRNMDRIVVLRSGRIIEQGTHNTLVRRGGAYARLWKMQSGGFIQD